MRRPVLVVLGACCALVLGAVAVLAQGPKPLGVSSALGTGFTYQGQLKKGNTLVNDPNCSLTFSLWDSPGSGSPPTGGTQLGSTQTISPVAVTNGLFAVLLNSANQFGPSAFNGQARWLQTAVQCTGDSSATMFARQSISAVPYALFAAAPWVSTGSDIAYGNGHVGIGTSSPGAVLNVVGNSPANTQMVLQGSGNVGGGLRIFPGGSGNSAAVEVYETSDTTLTNFSRGFMNMNYPVAGAFDLFTQKGGTSTAEPLVFGTDGTERMRIDTSGNVGIGTTSPSGKLDVEGGGTAVQGVSTATGDGVYGQSAYGNGVHGQSPSGTGVVGYSTSVAGVYGESPSGTGVDGVSSSGYGVYGKSNTGYAGYFSGNVQVSGNLTVTGNLVKGGGAFKIDHPLDPANQYLSHSFVESPDMMDIYNGNITTDERGEATVVLPDWFEALNQDFRYQLTPIGQFAQAMVASEIQDNRFSIKTDKPNVKVSWQVTGIRHDPYANAHRIPVEEEKSPQDQGKYLYPTEYGQPESLGIDYALRQRMQPPAVGP
jgi:hypothetical protein